MQPHDRPTASHDVPEFIYKILMTDTITAQRLCYFIRQMSMIMNYSSRRYLHSQSALISTVLLAQIKHRSGGGESWCFLVCLGIHDRKRSKAVTSCGLSTRFVLVFFDEEAYLTSVVLFRHMSLESAAFRRDTCRTRGTSSDE